MRRTAILLVAAASLAVLAIGLAGTAARAQTAVPERPGSLDEYVEQLWDAVASKLGIARQDLEQAVDQARQEVTDKAVEDGAMTRHQADRVRRRPFGGFGLDRMGRHGGPMGHRGHGDCAGRQEALAELLGTTVEDLADELASGKSIEEIARERGVDLQAERLERMKESLAAKVEAGQLTQEQADWMLEGLRKGFSGGRLGPGNRYGPMDRHQWRPCPDASRTETAPEGRNSL